uniref:Uncharacterized protein n=1 Tax=Calcidiscus leptoporus TaxID=127549 RepID=A0A7S0J1Y8_9EUKA
MRLDHLIMHEGAPDVSHSAPVLESTFWSFMDGYDDRVPPEPGEAAVRVQAAWRKKLRAAAAAAIDSVHRLSAQLLDELRALDNEANTSRVEAARLAARLNALEAEHEEAIAMKREELEAKQTEVDVQQEEMGRLRAALEAMGFGSKKEADTANQSVRDDLNDSHKAKALRVAATAELEESATPCALQSQLSDSRAELANARAQLKCVKAEAERRTCDAQQQVAALQAEVERTKAASASELHSLHAEVEGLQHELDQARSDGATELGRVQSELTVQEAATRNSRAELRIAQQEVAALQAEIERAHTEREQARRTAEERATVERKGAMLDLQKQVARLNAEVAAGGVAADVRFEEAKAAAEEEQARLRAKLFESDVAAAAASSAAAADAARVRAAADAESARAVAEALSGARKEAAEELHAAKSALTAQLSTARKQLAAAQQSAPVDHGLPTEGEVQRLQAKLRESQSEAVQLKQRTLAKLKSSRLEHKVLFALLKTEISSLEHTSQLESY